MRYFSRLLFNKTGTYDPKTKYLRVGDIFICCDFCERAHRVDVANQQDLEQNKVMRRDTRSNSGRWKMPCTELTPLGSWRR